MAKCWVRRALVLGGAMAAVVVAATAGFAHLCNNIYRTPDRVIVKPEKPTATVVGNEEFRVFVQNNYPTYLDNLRLAGKLDSDDATVDITPSSVRRLKAGERTAFKVKLTSAPGARQGRHRLSFSICADNIDWKPVTEAKVEDFRYVLAHEDNLSATVQAAESLVTRRDPEGSKYLQAMAGNRGAGSAYQVRALRALGKGGEKSNIPFIRTILQQRDGFVKGTALLALGLLGDTGSTFEPYYEDRDEYVRASAMAGRVLAGGKDSGLLKQLSQDLRSQNAHVRIAAGWALAARRDKTAIDVLDKAFTTDDAEQRTAAGDALVWVANRR